MGLGHKQPPGRRSADEQECYTGISKTPRPLRMMNEVAKELNVAWATKEGRRLPVRAKSPHRTTARTSSAGSRTGSRCSSAKKAEEASAARAKDTHLDVRVEASGPPTPFET